MTASTSFHRNVFLLTQVIPTSDDFKTHFHEGMFDKPNTVGFMHISQYLLTIYDAKRFRKFIQWPVTCKKTEVKYRNDVKNYLIVIANENRDVDFPPILASYLVCAHGTKFTVIMWKLSIVVLRTYIKGNCDPNILYAPRPGLTDELIKTTLQRINKDTISSIMSYHRNMAKMKEISKISIAEEEEILANIKHELFETKQYILHLISKAPVDSSIKGCLANMENTEIIQLWRHHITENLTYIKKKHMALKNVETLSNRISNMNFGRISGTEILDIEQLEKIHFSSISLLPLSANVENLLHHLYVNNKLMLYNFIQLFNLLLCQIHQCLRKNELKDLSSCLLQIEASKEDIKSGIKSFRNLRTSIATSLNNLKMNSYQKKVNQIYQTNISPMKNVTLLHFPVIKINTNSFSEGSDIIKRLELTPVEGAHKSLFSRYKRQQRNNNIPVTQLRTNLLVSRINFDDTISLNVSDKIPQHCMYISKTSSSPAKHTGKYSRLFLSRTKKATEKGNYSMLSIAHSSKANSTVITNTAGEIHNLSRFSLGNTTKSLFDLSKEVIIPEKMSTLSNLKSRYILEDINSVQNDQYKGNNETEKDSTTDLKDNGSNNVKDRTNRRSISDLVQRYKRILETTASTNT